MKKNWIYVLYADTLAEPLYPFSIVNVDLLTHRNEKKIHQQLTNYTLFLYYRNVYAKPTDIDIYVGGLAETPVAGGVIGDTFSCFLGKPFPELSQTNSVIYHGISDTFSCFLGKPILELSQKNSISITESVTPPTVNFLRKIPSFITELATPCPASLVNLFQNFLRPIQSSITESATASSASLVNLFQNLLTTIPSSITELSFLSIF